MSSTWEPGKVYQPGAIVTPKTVSQVRQLPPNDPDFEGSNLTDEWTAEIEGSGTGDFTLVTSIDSLDGPHPPFSGLQAVRFSATSDGALPKNGVRGVLKNSFLAPVIPGQKITAAGFRGAQGTNDSYQRGGLRIYWYDEDETVITFSKGPTVGNQTLQDGLTGGSSAHFFWVNVGVTGTAPVAAAFAQLAVVLTDNQEDDDFAGSWMDGLSWDYVAQSVPDGLIFKAVQTLVGTSAQTEPVWPVVSGGQVVDNDITWEAAYASRIVWTAHPIAKSASTEPVWPNVPGATVGDGSVVWTAMSRRVEDEKCPHSKIVAIAASKIFSADNDIVAYSATTNPLDWSTTEDAGFLPFGLQTYGGTDISALGLYRSNLVAFNSQGYQMWQVDEDPTNMALLDAQPVGVPEDYEKGVQPFGNDLAAVTSQGVRTIGIAGASTNLEAGYFGKQVDPLVLAKIKAGKVPRGLYYPAQGQYWVFFGPEALVLTQNGGEKDNSWSRYTFPATIDGWAILNDELYLRAGELIWLVSDSALVDNSTCTPTAPLGGGSFVFTSGSEDN